MIQRPNPERPRVSKPAEADGYVDNVTAGPGGVMTDDVGVITGHLTVRTVPGDDEHSAHVTVQCTGAEEWYTLSGSPTPVLAGQLGAYHRGLLDRIQSGGATQAT
ncbi:hypothetical protein AB5J72_35870 [Streptomyces sp. CG1]|uniref:hypothetical protein n=1 Tax=Streptomyces sp. CG1 TaxID=1287523 RepID=UPI0034E272DD